MKEREKKDSWRKSRFVKETKKKENDSWRENSLVKERGKNNSLKRENGFVKK